MAPTRGEEAAGIAPTRDDNWLEMEMAPARGVEAAAGTAPTRDDSWLEGRRRPEWHPPENMVGGEAASLPLSVSAIGAFARVLISAQMLSIGATLVRKNETLL